MPAQASSDELSRLSQEQLAELLSHVPLKERMSSCSLVHSSWRTAANLTITDIGGTNKRALTAWLQAHAQHVPLKSISVKHLPRHEGTLVLPAAQLQALQSLTLNRVPWALSLTAAPPTAAGVAAAAAAPQTPRMLTRSRSARQQQGQQGAAATAAGASAPAAAAAAAAWQDLASLPSLTSLTLVGSSVRLGGLAALTSLRELSCWGTASFAGSLNPEDVGLEMMPDYAAEVIDDMCPDESVPELRRNAAALASALPRLHSLTNLRLEGDIASQAVVAVLSRLQHLQQLRLQLEPTVTRLGLPSLPSSLTLLHLGFEGPSWHGSIGGGGGSSTLAAVLGQLSGLQVLSLKQVSGLDAVQGFQNLSSLRELTLDRVSLAPTPSQLKVLSNLTALQFLRVADTGSEGIRGRAALMQNLAAADAAALTAPPQLTSLQVQGMINVLTPRHYASMFPPNDTLPNLLELHVGTELLQQEATVRQVAACCVNLTSLKLTRHSSGSAEEGDDMPDAVAAGLAQGLPQLTCFSKLAALFLSANREQLPRQVWTALATLTGLRSLKICCWQPNYGDALVVSELRALEDVAIMGSNHIYTSSFECEVYLRSKAPAGSAPDVWQQMPSAFFKAADYQLMRAGMDGDFQHAHIFLQSQATAGEVVVQQLKERSQQLQEAEARNQQLQQELLQARQQLGALTSRAAAMDS